MLYIPVIWIFINSVVFNLLFAMASNLIYKWIWFCLGLAALEGLVLLAFKLSPLTIEDMSVSSSPALVTEDTNPEFDKVTTYPNPFTDGITVDLATEKVTLQEILIMNQASKMVYKVSKQKLENKKLMINLGDAGLNTGLYFLRYTVTSGKSNTIKAIKTSLPNV